MNTSFQMDFDYTLKIDFERCSVKELYYILQILYNSSTLCKGDIIEMANETIYRINEIGYELTNKQYRSFNKFIQSLYNVLKKLGIKKQCDIIFSNYNEFVKKPVPDIESPKSPETISPPKIMKKPMKKKEVIPPKINNTIPRENIVILKKGNTPRYKKIIKKTFSYNEPSS